jgi:phosphatidylglycerol:prolipoprotein diacylglycerol transferase
VLNGPQIAVDFASLGLRPEVFTIGPFGDWGPFSLRWYSLSYIFAILGGWWLLSKMNRRAGSPMNAEQLDSFITWATLGVIIGGRLGYVLFYNLAQYLENPLAIFRLWDGGMSSHGGILGVLLGSIGFGLANRVSGLRTLDYVATVAPLGLGLGRLANFVNGELWGRPTGTDWGVIFPGAGPEPRYPSQLFEFALEGVLLFSIMTLLFWGTNARLRPGLLAGVFGVAYGVSRVIVENYREPDAHIGFLSTGLTMGQTLTIPMIIAGILLILYALRRPRLPAAA